MRWLALYLFVIVAAGVILLLTLRPELHTWYAQVLGGLFVGFAFFVILALERRRKPQRP